MNLTPEEKAARIGMRVLPPLQLRADAADMQSTINEGEPAALVGPSREVSPSRRVLASLVDTKPFVAADSCGDGLMEGNKFGKRTEGLRDFKGGASPPQRALIFTDPPTLAEGLDGHKTGNNQWMARCPCHDDREPSLSIRWGRNGSTVVWCHARCEQIDVLAELRRRGFRLGRELLPQVRGQMRPVRLRYPSVALAACTLSERRAFDLLQAQKAKTSNCAFHVTYNEFCDAGVRRQSIPSGLRALEALGLIAVERAPFNFRKSRYDTNQYRSVDGWRNFEPKNSSPQAKRAASPRRGEVARTARKSKRQGAATFWLERCRSEVPFCGQLRMTRRRKLDSRQWRGSYPSYSYVYCSMVERVWNRK